MGVAQLVELRIVVPAVVGSNPIVHPINNPHIVTLHFKILCTVRTLVTEYLLSKVENNILIIYILPVFLFMHILLNQLHISGITLPIELLSSIKRAYI